MGVKLKERGMSILFLRPFVHEKNTIGATFYAPSFRRSKGVRVYYTHDFEFEHVYNLI
jgi:hypothetical protein